MVGRCISGMAIVASLLMTGAALAADATGTWQWTQAARAGGNPATVTLKLKQDGEKLTGTVAQPGGGPGRAGGAGGAARAGGAAGTAPASQPAAIPVEIKDGKVAGSDVTFNVTRNFGGNEITFKYTLKVEGDTLKGKRESEINGAPISSEIDAKRVKEESPAK